MSADREQDHLDMMSDMNSSRHWNQPYCYAEAEPDPCAEVTLESMAVATLRVSAVGAIKDSRNGR